MIAVTLKLITALYSLIKTYEVAKLGAKAVARKRHPRLTLARRLQLQRGRS